MDLHGIHHLTAITADVNRNHALLHADARHAAGEEDGQPGRRRAYHLFYADAQGSPGTDVTFFDWPMPRERRGTHSIVRTGLRVAGEATPATGGRDRLREHGVAARRRSSSATAGSTLDFEDPEGQRLALVADGGAGDAPARGTRAPCRPSTRSAGSGRSRSACRTRRRPTRC